MTKHCVLETCGKELVRKPTEHIAVFNKRKFCNQECAKEHFRQIKHWRDYPVKR